MALLCCLHNRSRTGAASRTSFRKRRLPTASEVSAAPQPRAQIRNAMPEGVSGAGASPARSSGRPESTVGNPDEVLAPATRRDGPDETARPTIWRGASVFATPSPDASRDAPSAAMSRAGRMGTDHDGPSRLSAGRASSATKVVVQNRWRVRADPRRASQVTRSARHRISVARAASPAMSAVATSSPLTVPPPRLHRSSP